MTDVGAEAGDKIQRPLSPQRGDDRRPPATADLADANRCLENAKANVPNIRIPTEEAKTAALRAPARVKRATGGITDVLRALENRHRWLLFAQHCYTCTRPEGACDLGKLCTYGKKTLNHVAQCKKEECSYPRCGLLKPLLQHSRRCQSSTCAICVPVWNYIQRDNQQQQPSQPPQPYQQQPDQQQKHQGVQHTQPGVGVNEHALPPSWPAAGIATSAGPSAHPYPSQELGPPRATDKAEGGATTSGAGAVQTTGPGGRLSSTGTAGLSGPANCVAAGVVGQGPRSEMGAGKLALIDKLDGPITVDARASGVHQHPQVLTAAVLPAGSAGSHRFLGIAPSPLASYGIPQYASSLPCALGGSHPVDSADRPKAGGITITATPAQPIAVANRSGVQAAVQPATVAGHPQLVHSYPPSTSIGAFFPQVAHHPGANGAAPAAAAVATHWLPLQSLAAVPAPAGSSAPPPNGVTNGGNGGSSSLIGSSSVAAGPAPQALWANTAPLRPGGAVTVYGIATDAVRPNGLSAVGPAAQLQTVDGRYGHPSYTLASVNSSGGMPPAGAITMAAGPLFLWPGGHTTPAAPSAAPPQQVGNPGAHMSTHLTTAAPYTMATMNGARISAGAAALGVGASAAAVTGLPAPPATAVVSAPQVGHHTLLYGHTGLAPAPASGGNPAGSALGTDVAPGAALWSYVLR